LSCTSRVGKKRRRSRTEKEEEMLQSLLRSRDERVIPAARFRNAVERLVEDIVEGSILTGDGEGGRLLPAVNIRETEEAVIAEAELPGLNQKDISVQVVGDTLTIRGERRHESEEKGRNYHRREIASGIFERQIPLPAEIDADGVEATYTNGILLVHLPKLEGSKPKTIPVKVK
jgi:HSP20 family protein